MAAVIFLLPESEIQNMSIGLINTILKTVIITEINRTKCQKKKMTKKLVNLFLLKIERK